MLFPTLSGLAHGARCLSRLVGTRIRRSLPTASVRVAAKVESDGRV